MSTPVREYVCGFFFTPDARDLPGRARVLLIRKRRPAWQSGKLNGVGGKIEPGETASDAMRREFREEAGLDVADWQLVLSLSGENDGGSGEKWAGHFFRAFGDVDLARAITDEALEIHDVRRLPDEIIPNLRWMIPLMLDEEPIAAKYRVTLAPAPSPP